MPRCVKTAHVFEKKWRSDDVRLQEEATFSSLLLPDKILLGLENAGYKTPSPIQLESIPVGRFGRDLLVQAKSGTGKTLVFTVIALESLSEIKYPQVLIMAPTREIALQICDVVRAVGSSFKGLTCNCFIGGVSVDTDVERVHGCQIIVGTPGRLKHLISLGILPTNSIRLLVLDEADVLLEPNFKDDLDYIFVSLPKEKQVIATSATYPRELRSLTRQYFRKAYLARLNRNELTLLGMVHYIKVLELPKMSLLAYKAKLAALEQVVTSVQFTQCLVFCNIISRVESLCYDIRNWGFTSTFISSAKEQCDRIRAIECLKRFRCKILVTSDVTSRGIDAENVDLVVNFDKPLSTEVYFHRCGRAGRYGAKGVAITFLEKDEIIGFEQMKVKHNLKAYNLPDPIPANLINIRPTEYNSSTEESVGDDDDDSSDDILNVDSNDHNNHSNGKIAKEDNCVDPSTLCIGKISSGSNGHLVENNNTNCKVDIPNECADTTREKNECTINESNISSELDTKKHSMISEKTESESSHENIENGKESNGCQSNAKESNGCKSNGDIVSNDTKTKLMDDTNSFLEYLKSGPKNAVSSSGSGAIVNNSLCSDGILAPELESNVTVAEANYIGFQNGIQHSSETQCSNNNKLEADNSVLEDKNLNKEEFKDSNEDMNNEELKDSDKKMVSPSDTQESLTQMNTSVISVDTSTPVMQNTSSDKVSQTYSNETKNMFVPNKIQLSVGKFLIEHVDNSDVSKLESLNISKSTEVGNFSLIKECSANKTETREDVATALKDIREDLTDFYSKVYKAYQTENMNDAAFERIKDILKQQKVVKTSEENSNAKVPASEVKNSDKKVTFETTLDGLNKENGQNSSDFKFCDINECNGSLHSAVSNESISSKKDGTPEVGKVFERHVFNNISSENLSSSDSSSIEDSYLTLKKFDNMKVSVKANSKTAHNHASQKGEKEKYINMKKNKFSENADKRQHSSPVNSRKPSDSKYSSISCSDEDTENKIQEMSGAKKKVYNKKQIYNHASNIPHEANSNKLSKNKAKPYNNIRIHKERNRKFSTSSEASENLHCSQNTHNTPTLYYEGFRSAYTDNQQKTSAKNNDYATGAVNYGNIPSINQQHEHNISAVNYGHISSMNQPHQHETSAVNYGHISSMNQPHHHETSALNCGTYPSMNQHNECRLPNHPYSHQTSEYAQISCAPNQMNVSHTDQESHLQCGSACCHNCSATWYQIYKKQWQFIHSSLF